MILLLLGYYDRWMKNVTMILVCKREKSEKDSRV